MEKKMKRSDGKELLTKEIYERASRSNKSCLDDDIDYYDGDSNLYICGDSYYLNTGEKMIHYTVDKVDDDVTVDSFTLEQARLFLKSLNITPNSEDLPSELDSKSLEDQMNELRKEISELKKQITTNLIEEK
jgi:hypothetical protein